MNQLAIAFALLAAAGCSKKSDDKAAPPTGAKAASVSLPAPTAAPTATAAPKLTSSVKLAVDPEALFANKSSTLDFSGPALVFANKQHDGSWSYEVVFYPPGVTATCDTDLDLSNTLVKDRALEIWFDGFSTEPTAGLELSGKYNLHFTSENRHTTGGLYEGAKVKLTKIDGDTVTGELSGETDTGSIKHGSGTFTGLLCKWADSAPAEEGTADDGGE